MKRLKIEMVHDVVCALCAIGYANLQQALRNLSIEADIHFLPFELNPDMPQEGETEDYYFKRRQGWLAATLQHYQDSLVKTASNTGVTFDFSKRTHYYNTRQAHKLMHWAEQFNKQSAVYERLIETYFKQGLDISNTGVLLDIAEELEMDRIATQKALSSSQVTLTLEKKIKRQQGFKARSFPAFILNEDTLIDGSNSVKFLENTLSNFIDELLRIDLS
ncbi:MAG: putative DsbA family dithiol-disulfide isomerase [Oleiphilaceae bacterium]|jgi:predicted DsbA family dithiol-disulfide isomerase